MTTLRSPTTIRSLALSPVLEPRTIIHNTRRFQLVCSRASCSSARTRVSRYYGPVAGLRRNQACQIKRIGAFSTSIIRRAKHEEPTTPPPKTQPVSSIAPCLALSVCKTCHTCACWRVYRNRADKASRTPLIVPCPWTHHVNLFDKHPPTSSTSTSLSTKAKY